MTRTVRRTAAELRQMAEDHYAGVDVTAHLSTMGMTIVAGQHGPRTVR